MASGAHLTYTLSITNIGPSPATGVRLTDTLPVEITVEGIWSSQGSCTMQGICTIGDLAPGGIATIQITGVVSAQAAGTLTNTAVVRGNETDPYLPNNSVTNEVEALQPAIAVDKTMDPVQAVPGMPLTVTLRITNTGEITLDPVRVVDYLPGGFEYIAGTGVPQDPDQILGTILLWNDVGALAPSVSTTLTFQVRALPGATGIYVNDVTVTGYVLDVTVIASDDAQVAITQPVLSIIKQLVGADTDDVFPNFITFTISIANDGLSSITWLPLADTYDPNYLGFVSAKTTPVPQDSFDDGSLTWYDLTGPAPYGFNTDLAPGNAFTVTVVFQVVQNIDSTTNYARVDGASDAYGNTPDAVEDDATVHNVPTAVTLDYFTVTLVSGTDVGLEWKTLVEVNNYGFNLYRAASDDFSQAILLTPQPVPAQGGGTVYMFTDTVPSAGQWWYWLQDVPIEPEITPQRTFAPVSANVTGIDVTDRIYLPLVVK